MCVYFYMTAEITGNIIREVVYEDKLACPSLLITHVEYCINVFYPIKIFLGTIFSHMINAVYLVIRRLNSSFNTQIAFQLWGFILAYEKNQFAYKLLAISSYTNPIVFLPLLKLLRSIPSSIM